MSFLTKASEYMLVGLLCLLFSLPVISAGAAITAGYYVGMKLLRDEDAGFFKSFINYLILSLLKNYFFLNI